MSKRLFALLCILLTGLFPLPVSARSTYTTILVQDNEREAIATLSAPIVDAFPHMEVYLHLRDSQGKFVHDLKTENIRLLENGNPAPVTGIRKLHPGVQFVAAIDPGPSLGIRNSQAISRYDIIKGALANWARSRQGSSLDDLSLLITGGQEISHTSDPLAWLEVLEADQTDARTATPNIDTLFQALALASDPLPHPGMSPAVLYITSPPENQSLASLENLISQATGQNIPVFVWNVTSSGGLQTQGAQRLVDLAERTGGAYFAFTGEEILPNPEEYLAPLRPIYFLTYRSGVSDSGTHELIAQVQFGGEQAITNARNFSIDIQPPAPAFVSPPIRIIRKPLEPDQATAPNDESADGLAPTEQQLQVVFDFPDGRLRPIAYSALFVDGEIVSSHTAPPFDRFIWDLTGYTADGPHQLRVEVRDSLGLVGASIDTPVQILIERPSTNPLAGFQNTMRRSMPILIGLIVLVAGAILLLVLILGGRLRPSELGALRKRRERSDPVTQPVTVRSEPSKRLPGWVNRLQMSQRAEALNALAFLSRIDEKDTLAIEPPIPITSDQVTFGANPDQADFLIDHPSIENLHARLSRQKDGTFRLSDQGSIAGTWVNYTPISSEGAHLEHGDIIHIGRIGYRFTLRHPTQVRKPVITIRQENRIPNEQVNGAMSELQDDPATRKQEE